MFSNGGIRTFDDVQKALSVTGADGVMVSGLCSAFLCSLSVFIESTKTESLLANPALFAGRGPYPFVDPLQMATEYIAFTDRYPTDASSMRAHLFKILHTQYASIAFFVVCLCLCLRFVC